MLGNFINNNKKLFYFMKWKGKERTSAETLSECITRNLFELQFSKFLSLTFNSTSSGVWPIQFNSNSWVWRQPIFPNFDLCWWMIAIKLSYFTLRRTKGWQQHFTLKCAVTTPCNICREKICCLGNRSLFWNGSLRQVWIYVRPVW